MADFPPPSLQLLAVQVSYVLRQRGHKVCVVETATGGLISATLLALPGASAVYAGGLTLYTLPSRAAFADWTPDHLAAYDGPTPAICTGLASSARARLCGAADASGGVRGEDETRLWALAESGTAGPAGSGDAPNRQPGYVALAVVGPGGARTEAERHTGSADRAGNMVAFARLALTLLRDCLLEEGEAKM